MNKLPIKRQGAYLSAYSSPKKKKTVGVSDDLSYQAVLTKKNRGDRTSEEHHPVC